MPKRSNNRRRGKTRRADTASNVDVLVKTVKTPLVGRMQYITVSSTTAGLIAETQNFLSPVSLGDRPNAVSAAFERYRINWIRFSWKSRMPSSVTGKFYMGVSDDTSVVNPTTSDQILNFRTSRECDVWKDCSMMWRPVDRKRWAYIRAEASNSDQRLLQFGVFTLIGDGQIIGTLSVLATGNAVLSPLVSSVIGTVDIEYSLVFDGATNDFD